MKRNMETKTGLGIFLQSSLLLRRKKEQPVTMLCICAAYTTWEYIKYHPAKSWEQLEFTELIQSLY